LLAASNTASMSIDPQQQQQQKQQSSAAAVRRPSSGFNTKFD
jgi:hypothetical protein